MPQPSFLPAVSHAALHLQAMPTQGDWSLLPTALWQQVLLSTRPLQLRGENGQHSRAWRDWVKLAVCLGSTCRALRAALLQGDEAAPVWDWTLLDKESRWPSRELDPERELARLRQRDLHCQLLRQARFATRAVVLSREGGAQAALQHLSAVQDLTLLDFGGTSPDSLAALSSHLRKLHIRGHLPDTISSPFPQGLKHLKLELWCLPQYQVRQLARCLPRLQRLELQVCRTRTTVLCDLQHLSLLPAEELCLTFTRDLSSKVMLSMRLRQLASVQLHTLDVGLWDGIWFPETELLLARCQVSHCVILRVACDLTPETEQQLLRRLPSGASVVYRRF